MGRTRRGTGSRNRVDRRKRGCHRFCEAEYNGMTDCCLLRASAARGFAVHELLLGQLSNPARHCARACKGGKSHPFRDERSADGNETNYRG